MRREQTQKETGSSHRRRQTYGRTTPTPNDRGKRGVSNRLDSDARGATTTSAAPSETAKRAARAWREDAGQQATTSRKAASGRSDTTDEVYPAHRRAALGTPLSSGVRRIGRIKKAATLRLLVDADTAPETKRLRINETRTNKQAKHRTTRSTATRKNQSTPPWPTPPRGAKARPTFAGPSLGNSIGTWPANFACSTWTTISRTDLGFWTSRSGTSSRQPPGVQFMDDSTPCFAALRVQRKQRRRHPLRLGHLGHASSQGRGQGRHQQQPPVPWLRLRRAGHQHAAVHHHARVEVLLRTPA